MITRMDGDATFSQPKTQVNGGQLFSPTRQVLKCKKKKTSQESSKTETLSAHHKGTIWEKNGYQSSVCMILTDMAEEQWHTYATTMIILTSKYNIMACHKKV